MTDVLQIDDPDNHVRIFSLTAYDEYENPTTGSLDFIAFSFASEPET